jgi:hypothetical protein
MMAQSSSMSEGSSGMFRYATKLVITRIRANTLMELNLDVASE